MQVTIITFGSRGDVQPFIHLGLGFLKAGHAVKLCAHSTFAELVLGLGIEFAALDGSNPQQSQRADYQRRPRTKIGVLWRILSRETRPDWQELRQIEQFIEGSDLVICNHLADRTYHAAEKAGIPCAFVYLHPTYPTRSFVSSLSPRGWSLGGPINLALQLALRHVYWLKNRGWINEWRTRDLCLKPISWLGPFREQYRKRLPYLFGFSPALIPEITDWPDWYLISGYWFQPGLTTFGQISADLKAFVEGGEQPVVVGFGSVASEEMSRIIDQTVRGIRRAGRRAVVVSGWGEHSLDTGDDIFVTASAPYAWLFPRAWAVIHAGGSGTAAESTRAGVPSVPVPFAAEQKFWSHRLWQLGVGTRPLRPAEVNEMSVAGALAEIAENPGMRVRAAELAGKVSQDGGTEAAVEFLSKWVWGEQREGAMTVKVGTKALEPVQ